MALPFCPVGVADLPDEILGMIIRHLDGNDLRNAASVCRKWRVVCHNFRDVRNKTMYQFLLRDVLGAFSPKYWTLAGSASYWLMTYVRNQGPRVIPGSVPYWVPNDADVWYIGLPGQPILRPFEGDAPAFPDANAQPADVHPFRLRPHEGNMSAYRCNYKIQRPLIPIHICLSPGTVFRDTNTRYIEAKFDMQFLQITVHQDPETKRLEFTTSYWPDHKRRPLPSRVKKYTGRFGHRRLQSALGRVHAFKAYGQSPL